MIKTVEIIRPSFFSKSVPADLKRIEFDYKNEVIIANEVPVDYVFIGDSITERWELDAYFLGSGKLVLNRGMSSDSTEYIFKRFDADVIQLKPKCVVLMAGVNDSSVMQYDAIYGRPGQTVEYAVKQAFRNIKGIVESCKQINQKIVLCSLLPTDMPFNINGNAINKMVLALNEKLKELAAQEGIDFVDYHKHLVSEDGRTLKEGLSYDGVHPNVNGYNIMFDVLMRTLQ
jgi:Lysophospholipase L1 and related esterases